MDARLQLAARIIAEPVKAQILLVSLSELASKFAGAVLPKNCLDSLIGIFVRQVTSGSSAISGIAP